MSEGFISKCRSTSGRHENFAKSEKVSKAWKVENRLVENRLVEIRLVEIRLVENKLKNRLVALVEARKDSIAHGGEPQDHFSLLFLSLVEFIHSSKELDKKSKA